MSDWDIAGTEEKPKIEDFVTGCHSLAKAKKYLAVEGNNVTGNYAIFDWTDGKWKS
jgi:hypothetical protein